ncbi:MAG TPA: leucine--tRNA ligase, partial [Pyrinomonadaceae bacterium]|nr:leucine--tRNA ligase [Pyrinomonadaceae bacterium]
NQFSMDEKYFAKKIEDKWQKKWVESRVFEAEIHEDKPKFYQLEMLPYPSGNLHMGHVRNYSVGDAIAWYKRLKGFNVIHPIGWDSFGQPAEDAAVKRGVNPRTWTEDNIKVMRGQLQRLGISYDWSRQIYAHSPEYYKFDQWFFIKMFEMGLAYKKMTQVNWCEHDQATLSNEQASGGLCWRCGNPVTKKDLEQWFLKTTSYADQLISDIAEIEAGWPQNVIKRQRDWIGKSEGAFVEFSVVPHASGQDQHRTSEPDAEHIRIFTTRIDTIYGANAILVAAEHPIVVRHLPEFSNDVLRKIQEIRAEKLKTTDHDAEIIKDGIDTGLKAVNPFSGEEIPVWIGNYVMMEYGTGAVMSVPAHDERDFEFAKKFNLPIKQVIEPPRRQDAEKEILPQMGADEHGSERDSPIRNPQSAIERPITEYGIIINSGEWNGKTTEVAKKEMADYAGENGFGEPATTYRLRDWGISRQRFWGAPIPMIYCDSCGVVPEKFENLPVELPETAPFTGAGESPLARVPEFYETTCPNCGEKARRETDTMDTFVDSSWYFFRYTDPANEIMPFAPEVAEYWTPVDQYIGGDDHAVMHLIYTRFWAKVMRDLNLVKFDEPVKRLLTQGMVIGETFFDDETGKRIYIPPDDVTVERDAKGKITQARSPEGKPLKHAVERMSKSKGNGVDPDEMVEIYGADAARLFILFAAPVENELVWNEAGIEGAVRFLQRVWRFVWKWHAALGGQWPVAGGPNTGENTTVRERASEPPAVADGEVSETSRSLRRKTHQTIKRVSDNLESLQFNTPVAALMELSNALYDSKIEPETASEDEILAVHETLTSLVLMLTPFAPHTAEELFATIISNENGILINQARFPEYSEELAKADEIEIAVQVNGKLRSRVFATPETANDELENLALADEKIKEFTAGKKIAKVIVVPKRLVNIVVKG